MQLMFVNSQTHKSAQGLNYRTVNGLLPPSLLRTNGGQKKMLHVETDFYMRKCIISSTKVRISSYRCKSNLTLKHDFKNNKVIS